VPDLLDHRLETLLVEPRTVPAWTRTQQKITRRRRTRGAGAAGVVALALVAAVVGTRPDDQATTDVHVGPPADEPASAYEPGWTRLPDPGFPLPTGAYPALVATDDDLYAWSSLGGATGFPLPLDYGVRYDTEARRWEPLPEGPADGFGNEEAVGLGDQVVFGGPSRSGTGQLPGLVRWDPASGENERISLPEHCEGRLPATGDSDQWFLACAANLEEDLAYHRYDVADGEWEQLPEPPRPGQRDVLTWTGDRLVVVGEEGDVIPGADLYAAAYSPEQGTWEELPNPPLADFPMQASWSGSELLVIGSVAGAVLDLDDLEWRTVEDPSRVLGLLFDLRTEQSGCTDFARAAERVPLVQSCNGVIELDDDDTWLLQPPPSTAPLMGSVDAGTEMYATAADGSVWAFRPGAPEPDPAEPTAATIEAPPPEPLEVGDASFDLPPGFQAVDVRTYEESGAVTGRTYTVTNGQQTCEVSSGAGVSQGEPGEAIPNFIAADPQLTFRDGTVEEVAAGRFTGPSLVGGSGFDVQLPALEGLPFTVLWDWSKAGGTDDQLLVACGDEDLATTLAANAAPSEASPDDLT
jgi:hypothetical protein